MASTGSQILTGAPTMASQSRDDQDGSERMAQRAAGPAANPAPPGQLGGQYRPLTDADMTAASTIAALRLLADLGMGEVPGRLADVLIGAGAVDLGNETDQPAKGTDRVHETLKKAAKGFTFPRPRSPPARSRLAGKSVHFGTGGAAVQTFWTYGNRRSIAPRLCATCMISPACRIYWPMSAGSPVAALPRMCPIPLI